MKTVHHAISDVMTTVNVSEALTKNVFDKALSAVKRNTNNEVITLAFQQTWNQVMNGNNAVVFPIINHIRRARQ